LSAGEKDGKSRAISERFTGGDRGVVPDQGSGLIMGDSRRKSMFYEGRDAGKSSTPGGHRERECLEKKLGKKANYEERGYSKNLGERIDWSRGGNIRRDFSISAGYDSILYLLIKSRF
jgi:hypothetical protein